MELELDMDMNTAIDTAADLAPTEGTDESVTEEATVEDQPEVEVETQAETPKEDAPAEVDADDGELAKQLAEFTHDEVVKTPAGQGLTAEMKRVRDRNRELEAELEALKSATPDEDDDTDDTDDDADVFTAADVKKILARELAKASKPAKAAEDKASLTQVMATGLAALKADKSVPAGVNTSKIVQDSIEALRRDDPAQLALLLSRSNPVEAVWKYATVFMPDMQQVVAKAAKAKADTEAERLAKGRNPDTGDEPQDMSSLIADLNA